MPHRAVDMDSAMAKITTALVAITLAASVPVPLRAQSGRSTGVHSCGLGPGSVHYQTTTVLSPDKKVRAFAEIEFRHESRPPEAVPCVSTYRLLVAAPGGKPRALRSLSERTWDAEGVTIVGFSPDSITRLVPSCDYQQNVTGVTNAGEVLVSIPAIRFSLPETGGCSAQGTWSFDLATGEVRRLTNKLASR